MQVLRLVVAVADRGVVMTLTSSMGVSEVLLTSVASSFSDGSAAAVSASSGVAAGGLTTSDCGETAWRDCLASATPRTEAADIAGQVVVSHSVSVEYQIFQYKSWMPDLKIEYQATSYR